MKYFLAVIASLSLSAQSFAIPITWEFGGTINTVTANDPDFPQEIAIGDPYSGSLTFETDTPLGAFDSYLNAIQLWRLDVNGAAFDFLPPVVSEITLQNDVVVEGSYDQYEAVVNARLPTDNPSYLWISAIGFNTFENLNFLSDENLSEHPPDIALVSTSRAFFMQLRGPRPQGALRPTLGTAVGSVDYLRRPLVAVPEPPTITLMLLSMAVLWLTMRRRYTGRPARSTHGESS